MERRRHGEDLRLAVHRRPPSQPIYKFFDLPIANYGSSSFDTVKDKSGKMVGYSMFGGYSYNERRALTLGVVNPDVKDGDLLTLVWGEENGGTKKVTRRAPQAARRAGARVACAVQQRRPRDVCRRLAYGEEVIASFRR